MPISKVQIEIWKNREELDCKLAKMTPQQRKKYFNGTANRITSILGKNIKLRRVKPSRRGPAVSESA